MSNESPYPIGFTGFSDVAKKFIKKICSPDNSTSKIKGKEATHVLPYANPSITSDKIWECEIYHNNKLITNNEGFVNALIDWYGIYAIEYNLNVDIMLAQAFRESTFNAWAYSKYGALGLTQFTPDTIKTIIIDNAYKIEPNFSNEEKNKILNNINEDVNLSHSSNRAILHQNVCNNPEIMIKAQMRYMRYLTNKSNNFASTALFCYNRGTFMSNTYLGAIEKASKYKNNWEKEGIEYVYKIFTTLYSDFKYEKLNMNINDNIRDTTTINQFNQNMIDLN